jgi:heat shock protein HtpX
MAIGLKTQIWNNNVLSLALLCAYPFLLLGMVWVLCLLLFPVPTVDGGLGLSPMDASLATLTFAPVVIAVVAIWFVIAWFYHTKLIRAVSHAHPVTRQQEPELYNMLENLCIAQGMAMPRLEIIETHARNAFASGLTDDTYTITLTRGLLQSLSADEVEAVIGHELAHIINRDVRLLMVCVIFTGMLGFLAQMTWSSMRYKMWLPRGGSGSGRGNALLVYLVVLAVLMIGYAASLLARFALSRRREYMADAGAVEMTKNPEAMMRALLRISGRDRIPEAPDDIALMCIENSAPFLGLFATHPPIEARVKAISEITRTPVPVLGPHEPAAYDSRFQPPASAHPQWLTSLRHGRVGNPWNQG